MRKRMLCLLVAGICCLFTACSSGTVKSAEPYTEGKGSSCTVTLDGTEEQTRQFRLQGGEHLCFVYSDVQGEINLELTDEAGAVVYQTEHATGQRDGDSVSIETSGSYTLKVEILEPGGSLSANIE